MLFRAVGPGLAGFGIAGALADPTLTVFRGADAVATNNDWGDTGNAAQIAAASSRVGAFALPSGSHDAALLLDLAPGSYTIQVSGARETTGVALAEIYEIAP